MLITFAARVYKYAAMRDNDQMFETGYTPVTAAARVQVILDDPDAMRERPTEISRLRRLRDMRSARSVRRRGWES